MKQLILIGLVTMLTFRKVAPKFIGRTSEENVNIQEYHIPVKIDPIKSGHIEQDIWGRYSYNFETPQTTRYEVREENGAVKGGYTFYDEQGLQIVNYRADSENGFQVTRTQLPIESKLDLIVDNPVIKEKNSRSLNIVGELPTDISEKLYEPSNEETSSVTDTPEVFAVRVAFADYQRAVVERNNLLRSNDNILGYFPFTGTIPLYDQFGIITPTGYSYKIDNI